MRQLTARGKLGAIGIGLLFTLVIATPAAAQVVKAEVGVDGMT
jgi:hypothetical protein